MSPARTGILAGGNWIVDHVKTIDRWPAQDALASILAETMGNGGSPYNILKNLARLGAGFPLEAAGLVGDDADGRAIRRDCAEHRIGTAHLRTVADAPTSYTDVMTVRGTGRRTFFHQRGANARLGPEHFEFAATSARLFHLGYLLLLDRLDATESGPPPAADVLRRARAAGLVTSVDCVSEDGDRFARVVLPVLPHTDVLFANDFEAEKITGVRLRGADGGLESTAVTEAARCLLAHGVRRWAVLHFPEGACAVSAAGETVWQPSVALPASAIAGAAGAGDAFAAGVLLGCHDAWPMARSLELGVCAAAASLRDVTCSAGVADAAACLALGAQHGFRALPG